MGREVVHEIAVENLAEGARGQDGSSGDRQRTSGDARAAQPPKVEASTKLRVGSGSRPRARIPGPAPPRERIANVICIRIKSPLKNVPTVLTDAILIIHPLSLPPPHLGNRLPSLSGFYQAPYTVGRQRHPHSALVRPNIPTLTLARPDPKGTCLS